MSWNSRARRSSVLFGDYAVGPFDQGDKDGWVTELRIPSGEIIFRNPTGSGASSSSKDGDVFGDDFVAQFTERRPTNGKHGIGGSLAHEICGVGGQEYLHLVTCVGQGEGVCKHK